jgi:hypothetical protein
MRHCQHPRRFLDKLERLDHSADVLSHLVDGPEQLQQAARAAAQLHCVQRRVLEGPSPGPCGKRGRQHWILLQLIV